MNKREKGTEYEDKVCRYLMENGYRILERNFYTNAGEIDIIAENEGYLCFIEVKYRADISEGFPEEAVDERKMRRIIRSAIAYLGMKALPESTPCRFDVAAVLGERITLYKNAYECT